MTAPSGLQHWQGKAAVEKVVLEAHGAEQFIQYQQLYIQCSFCVFYSGNKKLKFYKDD